MLKLAFCDDDTSILERLRSCAESCMGEAAQIRCFSDPGVLRKLYREEEHPFDCVFLDIEMPGCSGMELAGGIRRLDSRVLLAFVTSHEQFVYQAFEVEAFRYIPKKALEETLPTVLEAVRRKLLGSPERAFLTLKNKGAETRLALENLLYVEKSGKNCVYHTGDSREISVRQTIREAWDKLPDRLFVQIQSGILTNMREIATLDGGEVVLTNGERLPVSRLRSSEVKRTIHRFWSDEL